MFLQHIGNSIWKEDQQFLLNNLNAYRKKIENKKVKKARKITKTEMVYNNTPPELHHRSINSIVERLPYLENLLAGVSEIQNYNLKYQPFLGQVLERVRIKS